MPASQYKGVPEGASAIIPRLYCHDVDAQIEFCRGALGAVEGIRRPGPDGRTQHAMLLFGSSMLMIEAGTLKCRPGPRILTAALQW
jgi:PhnB protein